MNSKFMGYLILVSLSLFLVQGGVYAEGKPDNLKSPAKVNGSPTRTYLDINKISTQFYNDGRSDIDNSGNSGFEFPIKSGKTCVFQSGFLWGAKVPGDAQVRVGGSAYGSGLQGGKIISPGVAEDPALAKNRIYRVRADIYPGSKVVVDLTTPAAVEHSDINTLQARYLQDWKEWPIADGAPYWISATGDTMRGVKGADQTIWFVANDLNGTATQGLYGAKPLGIELQVTVWAYNESGALGSMLFRQYKIINKSTTPFTDMYVSQWSDPDDGFASDDYAGCDKSLSLGYVYNANATDNVYNPLPPPAVGFDFFQGPKVGNAYLPMTSFYYFANGDANVTDPKIGDIAGSNQFYNFFQGRVGLTGKLFVDPTTGDSTQYVLTGDPQKMTGWLDGKVLAAGDRRIGLASGPFTMAIGDTQVVVVAEIAAGAVTGVDRLSAVGLLKFYDQQAQTLYDNNFVPIRTPPGPAVTKTELDKEVILNWDNNPTAVAATEGFDDQGYTFQGYNVYQLPTVSSALSEGKLLATYDVVDGVGKIEDKFFDTKTGVVATGVIQFGNDNGVQRYLDIKTDALLGGTNLINGIKYYFAVTAYSYNPNALVVTNKESTPDIITVIPHTNNPGVVLSNVKTNDKITDVVHASGIANATVNYTISDPTLLTGAKYTLGFSTQPDLLTGSGSGNSSTAAGEVKLVLNEAGTQVDYTVKVTDIDLASPVVDAGFADAVSLAILKPVTLTTATVLGHQIGTASGVWSLTSALKDQLVKQNIAFVFNGTDTIYVPVTISTYPWYLDRGTTRVLSYQRDLSLDNAYLTVDGIQPKVGNLTFSAPITFASWQLVKQAVATEKNPVAVWGDGYNIFGYASGKGSDFYGGGGSVTPTDLVQDIELRFTGVAASNEAPVTSGGSWATMRSRTNAAAQGLVKIPFEVWEVERNRQINCYITDRNVDVASPWGNTGLPQWYRIAGRNYIEFIASPYDSTVIHQRTDPFITWDLILQDGESGALCVWHTGDVLRITYANPIVPGVDTYTFTAPSAKAYDAQKAKEDVKNIQVFPNPYYGVNSEELTKYDRFVTFSHLPPVAKIRIFTLSGVLVKVIDHNSTSQFDKWNLANEAGLPVASGLYIAYIDMPGLGMTKTLKLAIIQEQQILDHF